GTLVSAFRRKSFGVGEKEHLSAAADELQGLLHGGVGGHGDDGGVEMPNCRSRGDETQICQRLLTSSPTFRRIMRRLTSAATYIDDPFSAEFSGEAQARFEQ